MKKLLILVAALLLVGSAFAQSGGRLFVQPNASNIGSGAPSTTNNDDSCDISTTPAATLLLPWFEVDFNSDSTSAVNTVFTITNTSSIPQIAHVTVWTDWSFPVLDFNIYLTGYDVQGVSMYDIIALGNVPATTNTDEDPSPVGEFSDTDNPNFLTSAATTCANLPGSIPNSLKLAIQSALTGGDYTVGNTTQSCDSPVGGTHANAIGYVTVDVAATCSTSLPTDPGYFGGEILFDNTLIGDYERINPTSSTGNYAGGNPMVAIRAIPEGGPADVNASTNMPFTFYDRYTAVDKQDRRQPLPSMWAARYIENGGSTQDFATDYAIWREGPRNANCSNVEDNANFGVTEIVRFDEHENPFVSSPTTCYISPCDTPGTFGPQFSETGAYSTTDETHFPPDITSTSDLGGWMYLNLGYDTGGNDDFQSVDRFTNSLTDDYDTESSWVIVQMTAEGRYGVDFDAAFVGAGCTPNPGAWVDSSGVCQPPYINQAGCGIGSAPNNTPLGP